MPVNLYEIHPFSGRPFQLYEFIRTSNGIDYFWRYNSSDRNVWYSNVMWKAVPIIDSGVRLSGEALSTDLEVTMPINEEFCEQFRLSGSVPSDTVWLRIRRVHAGDLNYDNPDEPTLVTDALLIWNGTVNGINQIGELEARVRCSMLSASLRRGGLRYGYQKNCPHVLYASNTCKVDREPFKIFGGVTAISGNIISVDEFGLVDEGYFNGGFLEYTLPSGMMERRMILTHSGTDVVIMGLPVGMAVTDTISAFPGCDRTVDTCVDKFNNLANFGGFPHSPGRNPFDGNPVFDWWFVPLLSLSSLAEFL
jgi:uncharacterized phage protein (TIGR02218 family)